MNHTNISARMAGGYMLWTACGAGIGFTREINVPWLITSAASGRQVREMMAATAAFVREQDTEHSKARDALEKYRKDMRTHSSGIDGFDAGSKEEETRLKEEAAMTCQPVIMDMTPDYGRLVQALQDSRYRSCGLIDRGPGRASFVSGGAAYAKKRLGTDPVLRVLQNQYCTTMVRSSNGGAVMYKSFDRATFFNLTAVSDAREVFNNLGGMDSILQGSAVILPGAPACLYDASQFSTLLNRVHVRGREPVEFSFSPAWQVWFTATPDVGVHKLANKKIAEAQGVVSWDSLRSLVIGVLAAERMLEAAGRPDPEALVFSDLDVPAATGLLTELVRLVYNVSRYDESSAVKSSNVHLATEARAAKWQQDASENVHNWFQSVQHELMAAEAPITRTTLTRGRTQVLTAGQLDAVLKEYPADITDSELGVRLLRQPMPAHDPDVSRALDELHGMIGAARKGGGQPWIPFASRTEPMKIMWRDMVRACPTLLTLKDKQGVKVVTILRRNGKWVTPWQHWPAVVAAAKELGIQYQDQTDDKL